jgi:hypothetical protein
LLADLSVSVLVKYLGKKSGCIRTGSVNYDDAFCSERLMGQIWLLSALCSDCAFRPRS